MKQMALALAKRDLALPMGFNGLFDAASYKLFVEDFGAPGDKTNLLENEAFFVETSTIDEGKNHLQFFGYIPLRVISPEGAFVACFQREKGGKYSIGIGSAVVEPIMATTKLVDHLAFFTGWELSQTAGIEMTHQAMVRAITNGHFLYAPDGAQESVRLAICPIIDYPRMFDIEKRENTALLNLHWERVENLHVMCDSGLLESWSAKIVKSNMLG